MYCISLPASEMLDAALEVLSGTVGMVRYIMVMAFFSLMHAADRRVEKRDPVAVKTDEADWLMTALQPVSEALDQGRLDLAKLRVKDLLKEAITITQQAQAGNYQSKYVPVQSSAPAPSAPVVVTQQVVQVARGFSYEMNLLDAIADVISTSKGSNDQEQVAYRDGLQKLQGYFSDIERSPTRASAVSGEQAYFDHIYDIIKMAESRIARKKLYRNSWYKVENWRAFVAVLQWLVDKSDRVYQVKNPYGNDYRAWLDTYKNLIMQVDGGGQAPAQGSPDDDVVADAGKPLDYMPYSPVLMADIQRDILGMQKMLIGTAKNVNTNPAQTLADYLLKLDDVKHLLEYYKNFLNPSDKKNAEDWKDVSSYMAEKIFFSSSGITKPIKITWLGGGLQGPACTSAYDAAAQLVDTAQKYLPTQYQDKLKSLGETIKRAKDRYATE